MVKVPVVKPKDHIANNRVEEELGIAGRIIGHIEKNEYLLICFRYGFREIV